MAKKNFTFEPFVAFMKANSRGHRNEIAATLLGCFVLKRLYFKPMWVEGARVDRPMGSFRSVESYFITK